MYKQKYYKYKNKYLQLQKGSSNSPNNNKNNNKTNNNTHNYKFLHFNNIKDQEKYIKQHVDRIVDMKLECFPSNVDKSELIKNRELKDVKMAADSYNEIYRAAIYELTQLSAQGAKWYFVVNGDDNLGKIIGFCTIGPKEVIHKKDIAPNFNTYEEIPFNQKLHTASRNTVTIEPVIFDLCKDKNYKQVGSFLLDKVSKDIGDRFNSIYLIAESFQHINGFGYFFDLPQEKNCVFTDPAKFKESNKRLVEYYQSQGFVPSEYVEIRNCSSKKNAGQFIEPVLVKDLNAQVNKSC